MFWATTTFKVAASSAALTAALTAWKEHIDEAHPLVKEVRCSRFNGGTTYVWQEGFDNFNDYQVLNEQEDDVCSSVMGAVFAHEVPGTRITNIWRSVI